MIFIFFSLYHTISLINILLKKWFLHLLSSSSWIFLGKKKTWNDWSSQNSSHSQINKNNNEIDEKLFKKFLASRRTCFSRVEWESRVVIIKKKKHEESCQSFTLWHVEHSLKLKNSDIFRCHCLDTRFQFHWKPIYYILCYVIICVTLTHAQTHTSDK